jgi:hypothetical protein
MDIINISFFMKTNAFIEIETPVTLLFDSSITMFIFRPSLYTTENVTNYFFLENCKTDES